jgi:hypothetical protein
MACWVQCLQEYNNADALSWKLCWKECTHCQKAQEQADVKMVWATAYGWDPPTQREKQLSDHDVGPIVQEMEAGQHLEWKDHVNWATGPNGGPLQQGLAC